MARELQVRGVQVKVRSPWGVWGLTLITFGIYGFVWWYKINRELRDFSAAPQRPLGNDPALSVLALIPGGWVVLPPFFSYVGTARRTRHCLEIATGERPDSPSSPLTCVLAIIVALHTVYLQGRLNRLWEREERVGGGGLPPLPPLPPAAGGF